MSPTLDGTYTDEVRVGGPWVVPSWFYIWAGVSNHNGGNLLTVNTCIITLFQRKILAFRLQVAASSLQPRGRARVDTVAVATLEFSESYSIYNDILYVLNNKITFIRDRNESIYEFR